MEKCLTICLAFLILATSSPTNQGVQAIIKMSAFFHHFIHHLACHQEKIGIVDFVQLHYSDHEHHEADHAEHGKLPFQHHHHDQQNVIPQTPFLLTEPQLIAALPKLETVSSPLIARQQQWLSSLHSGDIWQPPKV